MYRLYVQRDHGAEEVIDVGRQTSAEIPIGPNDEEYWVSVGVVIEDHGEVGRSEPEWYGRRPLELSMFAQFSPCPPSKQAPLRVQWRIMGGAPPFTLSIGDALGFETDERDGSSVVDCRTGTDGTLQDIRAWVIDAYGQTDVDTLGSGDFWSLSSDWEEDPFSVQLGLRSVHRERVLLSWNCRYWPFTAVLRWRLSGDLGWTYVPEITQARDDDWRCRGSWEGLEPLTTYEYQLARYDRPGQLRQPERMRWTESETVTTLGEAQQPAIERIDETVTVSWQRQPDAWAYVVGLRAEGRSWWKRYEPSGESRETIYFYRVPRGLRLSVELVSPPLKDGEESRPTGFDPNVAYGE